MNTNLENLYQAALKCGVKLAYVTAGGGVGLYNLFMIPGSSQVMSEARMLYSEHSFHAFLGKISEDRYVSQEMADKLALKLIETADADICVALTCALKTQRIRQGTDHGYLAICQSEQIKYRQHIIINGSSRQEQDAFISETVADLVASYLLTQ